MSHLKPETSSARRKTITHRPRASMEVLDVPTGTPKVTGLGGIFKTDALTHAEYERVRAKHGIPLERAEFLIDYHPPTGELPDTIGIDSLAFTALFKHPPAPPEYYELYDQTFWRHSSGLQAAHAAARAAVTTVFARPTRA